MLEPLGQSQVMAYLRILSIDYCITLISFEKANDIKDKYLLAKVKADCDSHNIKWLPQPFYYKPKFVAPAWSMVIFLYLCLREVSHGSADIIHARSYIPAAVALVVNRLKGTPFIFDMRALWPEELVTAGVIKNHSFLHKFLVNIERRCLHRATTVVSLTHAAVDHLVKEYPKELIDQNIVVIPTCADLERFAPLKKDNVHPIVYSCLGTVLSGWFKVDWLATCFNVLAKLEPEAYFEIVTRDDPDKVRNSMGDSKHLQSRLKVYSLPSDQVHKAIQTHTASVMFFNEGLGKLGSSPTRMGEILGCGLPVIANAGVGDVARIIEKYRVGVLVNDGSSTSMEKAINQLTVLMQDPELELRCRYAAQEVFSLVNGAEAYRNIYETIIINQDIKPTKNRAK